MEKSMKAVGVVSSIGFYPVKSAYVLDVPAAHCTETGLYLSELDIYDRQYVILMPNGKAASLREYSKLTLIRPSVQNGRICLDAPDLPTLELPADLGSDSSDARKVNILDQHSEGIDCGDEVGEWLSKHLGKTGVRLLCFNAQKNKRTLEHAQPIFKHFDMEVPKENPKMSFPDFAPYTLLSEESVTDLNTRLQNTVTALNFRANIVMKGCAAHEEDSWKKVKIGSAEFSIFTLDPRCTLITIDPKTGVRDPHVEPFKTLKTYRPVKEIKGVKWPHFGVYMVLTKAGHIQVGDAIYCVE